MGNDATAARALVAARVLMQTSFREALATKEIVVGDKRLRPFLLGELLAAREESLLAMYLDARGRYIRGEMLCVGSSHGLTLRTRSLVQRLLELNAGKVLLAHNHPSGLARPSEADCQATAEIEQILHSLGIELIDHCIVAGGDVFSMRLGRVL